MKVAEKLDYRTLNLGQRIDQLEKYESDDTITIIGEDEKEYENTVQQELETLYMAQEALGGKKDDKQPEATLVIPPHNAPKQEIMNCLVSHVTGVLPRVPNPNVKAFRLITFIKPDRSELRLAVNEEFFKGTNGDLDPNNAVNIVVDHTVAGVTEYFERRKNNVNYGKILKHPGVQGTERAQLSGVRKLSGVEESVVKKPFHSSGNVIEIEAYGKSLSSHRDDPMMFNAMKDMFVAASAATAGK